MEAFELWMVLVAFRSEEMVMKLSSGDLGRLGIRFAFTVLGFFLGSRFI